MVDPLVGSVIWRSADLPPLGDDLDFMYQKSDDNGDQCSDGGDSLVSSESSESSRGGAPARVSEKVGPSTSSSDHLFAPTSRRRRITRNRVRRNFVAPRDDSSEDSSPGMTARWSPRQASPLPAEDTQPTPSSSATQSASSSSSIAVSVPDVDTSKSTITSFLQGIASVFTRSATVAEVVDDAPPNQTLPPKRFHELFERVDPTAICVDVPGRYTLTYGQICGSDLSRSMEALLRAKLSGCEDDAGEEEGTGTRDSPYNFVVGLGVPQSSRYFLPLLVAVSRAGGTAHFLVTEDCASDRLGAERAARNAKIRASISFEISLEDCEDSTDGDHGQAEDCARAFGSAATAEATPSPRRESSEDRTDAPFLLMHTGGTQQEKCAAITHAMFVHEAENWGKIIPPDDLPSGGARVAITGDLFWPAHVLGQISIALAFGGTSVFLEGSNLRESLRRGRVNILGAVPRVMRDQYSADPLRFHADFPGVRYVLCWGGALDGGYAKELVAQGVKVIDVLIATEFWLCLAGRVEVDGRAFLKPVAEDIDVKLVCESGSRIDDDDEGAGSRSKDIVGILHVRGSFVASGYHEDGVLVQPANRFVDLAGEREVRDASGKVVPGEDLGGGKYFCTGDRVRVTEKGLVFAGRDNFQVKIRGRFVDLEALRAQMELRAGQRVSVDLLRITRDENLTQLSEVEYHFFVCGRVAGGELANALGNGINYTDGSSRDEAVVLSSEQASAVRGLVPSDPAIHCRFLATPLPLNATGTKIDRSEVIQRFCRQGPPQPSASAGEPIDKRASTHGRRNKWQSASSLEDRVCAMYAARQSWHLRVLFPLSVVLTILHWGLNLAPIIIRHFLQIEAGTMHQKPDTFWPKMWPPVGAHLIIASVLITLVQVGFFWACIPMLHLLRISCTWDDSSDGYVRRKDLFVKFKLRIGKVLNWFRSFTGDPFRESIHFEVGSIFVASAGMVVFAYYLVGGVAGVAAHAFAIILVIVTLWSSTAWLDHIEVFWLALGIFTLGKGGPGAALDRLYYWKDDDMRNTDPKIDLPSNEFPAPVQGCERRSCMSCNENAEMVYVDRRGCERPVNDEEPRCETCSARDAERVLASYSSDVGAPVSSQTTAPFAGRTSLNRSVSFSRPGGRSNSRRQNEQFGHQSRGRRNSVDSSLHGDVGAGAVDRYSVSEQRSAEDAFETYFLERELESAVLGSQRRRTELQAFLDQHQYGKGSVRDSPNHSLEDRNRSTMLDRSDDQLSVSVGRVLVDFLPGFEQENGLAATALSGLDSTSRMQLASALRLQTGRDVPLLQGADTAGDVFAIVREAPHQIEDSGQNQNRTTSERPAAVWFVGPHCKPMGSWRYIRCGAKLEEDRMRAAFRALLDKHPILRAELSTSVAHVEFMSRAAPVLAASVNLSSTSNTGSARLKLSQALKRSWPQLVPRSSDFWSNEEQVRFISIEHDLNRACDLDGNRHDSQEEDGQPAQMMCPVSIKIAQLSTSIANSLWKVRSRATFAILQVGSAFQFREGQWRGVLHPLGTPDFHSNGQRLALWFAECVSPIDKRKRLVWLWPEEVATLGMVSTFAPINKSRPAHYQDLRAVYADRTSSRRELVLDANVFSFVFIRAVHSHADNLSGQYVANDLFQFYGDSSSAGSIDPGMSELEKRLFAALDGQGACVDDSRCSLRGHDFLYEQQNRSYALLHTLKLDEFVVRALRKVAEMYRTSLEHLLIGRLGFSAERGIDMVGDRGPRLCICFYDFQLQNTSHNL